MGKYDPLRQYLAVQAGAELGMSFSDIEELVGPLPATARQGRTWWTTDSQPQARAWHAAGWRVLFVDQTAERVTFAGGAGRSLPAEQALRLQRIPEAGGAQSSYPRQQGQSPEIGVHAGLAKPDKDDSPGWARYWSDAGQPWRKRPQIPIPRQTLLLNIVHTKGDILKGSHPFKGVHLHREDVEWLIDRFQQRKISHLDLRGSDLSGEDLSGLPLSNMLAGVSGADWRIVDQGAENEAQRDALFEAAAVNLSTCNLTDADLRNASLTYADLRGAKLSDCRLDGADLFRANFGGDLPANLHGVILSHATRLNEAILASRKGVAPRLFDVQWNDASLSGVDWSAVKKVADEKREYHKARRRSGDTWSVHNRRRIIWYSEAAQTYRQLSIALRSQGMNDQARRFTYRAEVARFWSLLHSLTQPKQWAPFVFSLLLGSISGWGYRLYRSAILYVTTILIFADLYRATSRYQYNWREAVVLSIIAFHGRAFSPNDNYGLGTTFSAVAAAEAFVGLFIEAIVIATFTRRLFSD